MKTITYIDKSRWPKGEWNDEPDVAYWIDDATGYPCIINRNTLSGGFCAYVGISKQNSYFKKDYDIIDDDFMVYGGLTFSDFIRLDELELFKNDIWFEERSAHWWIGFDCMHHYDYFPLEPELIYTFFNTISEFQDEDNDSYNRTYKNFDYVKKEVTSLAKQLNDKGSY